MKPYDINLKPFKNDNFDKKRYYDLLRALIFYKELIRINFQDNKAKYAISRARLDIPQYKKLIGKYPEINLKTLNKIATSNRYKIIIWTKTSSRAVPEKTYETTNIYDLGLKRYCLFTLIYLTIILFILI